VEALLPLSHVVGGCEHGRQADTRSWDALVARGTRTTRPSGAGVLIPCLRRARRWVPNTAPTRRSPPNSDPTGTHSGTEQGRCWVAEADRCLYWRHGYTKGATIAVAVAAPSVVRCVSARSCRGSRRDVPPYR
jgi:hypothetical protein